MPTISTTKIQTRKNGSAENMSQLAQLTNAIENASVELDTSNFPAQDKQQLLTAARKLVDRLEDPEIGIWKVSLGVSIPFLAIKRFSRYPDN